MKKKIWKQIIAVIMSCTLITGTAGSNTALAAGNKKNITATSLPVKVSGKTTKESSITGNIKPEERTPEFNRILNECEEIQTDGISKEIRKGQIVSVESISGSSTKMAIMSNGDLYCWGENFCGQIGNGVTENQLTPYKVLSGVKSAYFYGSFVTAITENGDLYCWGNNEFGQVGNGTTENQLIPYKVLSGIKSTYSYYFFVTAITENGDLYCWGNNEFGPVGNGTTESQLTPYKVLSGIKSTCFDYSFVTAITENGDLYCWGNNEFGQVGNGTTESQLTPYKVLSGIKSVSCSKYASSISAITKNGDLYCWGNNRYGQIGNGTTENQLTPYKVLSGIKSTYSYYFFVTAITENGDLYCWGYNGYGQIGNGTTKNQLIPYKTLSEVKSVSCPSSARLLSSFSYSISAITENGDLYCWGDNYYGQAGNGTIKNQLTPYKVLNGVKSVTYSFNDYTSISAITENGDLYCWGYNEYGQIGNGTTYNQLTPYKVLSGVKSVVHSFSRYNSISAITENGDLYCWGYNFYGQTGYGTSNQLTPYKVLSGIKSVIYSSSGFDAPYYSVSAITENGDLYCWGDNECGQTGNGIKGRHTVPPVKILPTDNSKNNNITKFSVTSSVSGELEDKITFSGSLTLPEDKETSSDILDEEINNITWTSGDPAIAEVTKCECTHSSDNRSATLLVSVTPHKEGSVVIVGRTSDGVTASCIVTVGETVSSIKKITHTGTIKNNSYGVNTYETTVEGRIYNLAIQFNKVLDDYMAAIKSSAENDLKNTNNNISSLAKELRKKDKEGKDVIISMEYNTPETVIFSVYQTLAMYLQTCTQTGVDIGKIDLSKSIIEIDAGIVKKIRSKIGGREFKKKVGQYTVTFDVLEAMGAYTGKVEVTGANGKKYIGIINAPASKTAEIMTQYIDELSETVKDLLKQSLISILSELSQKTGISEFTESGLKKLFKNSIDLLRKNGYGDILKNTIKLKDGYELIKKIVSAKDSTNLKNALNSISGIYNKLKSMDYSDASVTKTSINIAMKKVNQVKSNLENAMYEYIYNTDNKEEENIWEWIKKIFIQCPVDFKVYDKEGNILGYVENGDVYYNEKILIETSGDVKTIYIPQDIEVDIQFIATGNGEMNYVIEEMQNGKITGRMNYYGLELEEGKGYSQTITSLPLSSDVQSLPIKTDEGQEIFADEYLSASDIAYVTVNCSTCDGGVAIGGEKYPKGTPVELSAFPEDDTYEFDGWYIGGNLVELNNVYRFTALKNVNVYANFKKKNIEVFDYDVILGRDYEETAWVDIYKNEVNSEDIVVRLYGLENRDNLKTASIKGYSSTGECISNNSMNTEFDNDFSFWLKGVSLGEYSKMEIYDSLDGLIARILPHENISEENPDTTKSPTPLPDNSPSAIPIVTPSPLPSNLPEPTAIPTSKPFGGSSGEYIPGPAVTDPVIVPSPVPTPSPSQMPSPSPTAVPVITITPAPVQTPLPTSVPEITATPSVMPKPSQTPEATLTPSVSPVVEENNTSSSARLKKGSKIADKKTKAVYKIISTGKNKTAEYAKSIKKNTINIAIPASVKLRGKIFKVVSVGKGAFKNNKKLKSVNIGKNVRSIAKEAFSGCKKLAKAKIGKNVNSIEAKAFSNCTSLTIITIPSKVKEIGEKAFYKCKNLQYILVKTKKLKANNIGIDAFGKVYSNPRIKSDKSVWKQYQDVFISKGLPDKALFIVNPVKLVV